MTQYSDGVVDGVPDGVVEGVPDGAVVTHVFS